MSTFVRYLTLLSLILLLPACNLARSTTGPQTSISTPALPSPTIAPSQTQPAAPVSPVSLQETPTLAAGNTPVPTPQSADFESLSLPPADYGDIFETRIASGEWTQEEGLVTLLKLFAGELTLDETAIDTSTFVEFEATGIQVRAADYLKNGSDEATKAEITRLLQLIVPSSEALLRYSQEDNGQGKVYPGAAMKLAAPLAQQDCAALWAAGFPAPTDSGSFPCFLANSQRIGGRTYQVFFPTMWMGDAAKAPYYEMTRQAIADSVPVMRRYGDMRSIYFVFNYAAHPTSPMTTLASTFWGYFQVGEACPVIIWPALLALSEAEFKQTIAHEIFHCFSAFNLRDQMFGAGSDMDWWQESGAEYFSNLVYPSTDYEYRFLAEFNERSNTTPLVSMTYQNFLFIQFLGNELGPEGVIDFFRSMPTQPGIDKQLAALADYPDMANLFEEFTQKFLDNRIQDTSGAIKPYTPLTPPLNVSQLTGGPGLYKPFVLRRYNVFFPMGTNYMVTHPDSPADVRIGYRPSWAPGFWSPEASVEAGCDDMNMILYTIGTGRVNQPGQFPIALTEEPMSCNDACLVGQWQLDNNSYANYAAPLLLRPDPSTRPNPNGARLKSVEGVSYLSFTNDGGLLQDFNDFVISVTLDAIENNLGQQVAPQMQVTMHGRLFGIYQATGTSLDATLTGSNLSVSASLWDSQLGSLGSVELPVEEKLLASGPMSGATQYLCSGDFLFLEVPIESQPVLVYTRVP